MITSQLVSFPDYILSQNMNLEDRLFHFGRHSTDPAFDRLWYAIMEEGGLVDNSSHAVTSGQHKGMVLERYKSQLRND